MILRELAVAGLNGAHRGLDHAGEIQRLRRRDVALRRRLGDRGDREGEVLLRVERRQVELDRRHAAGCEDAGEAKAQGHVVAGERPLDRPAGQICRRRIEQHFRHARRLVARAPRPPRRIARRALAPAPLRIPRIGSPPSACSA